MAFLMDDADFDRGSDALCRRGIEHLGRSAGAALAKPSTGDGRRLYFEDLSGQLLGTSPKRTCDGPASTADPFSIRYRYSIPNAEHSSCVRLR